MKILWIAGAAIVGGAERVTLDVLTRLAARGHAVEALLRAGSPLVGATRAAGLAAAPARIGGAWNVRSVRAIDRALAEFRPDVALVTTSDEWVWASLAGRGGARFVFVRHMALPLSRLVLRLAGRRANLFVAVSEAARARLLEPGVLPAERVVVISNPVRFPVRTTVPDSAERARARAALGLPIDGPWLGFFGGLGIAKGVFDFLHVVGEANGRCGPVRALICGREDRSTTTASLEERIRRAGLEGRVHVLGEIESVVEAMTAVDLVVGATSSRLAEGLPGTLLEAMACGTPVVAYRTGGVAEAVGDDGARLAPADDRESLARIAVESLRDPSAARELAARALGRVRERFDADRATDAYEQAFCDLLEPRAPRDLQTAHPAGNGPGPPA